MLREGAKNKKCGNVSIKRTKLEYLSSIVFHTVVLKCFEKGLKQEMWLRFYKEDRIGESSIDRIPHCHTLTLWNTIDDRYSILYSI